MNRTTALLILGGFSLLGVWAAHLGLSDIRTVRADMLACLATVRIDHSAFLLLSMVLVPLFPLLAVLPDKHHSKLFSLVVALGIALPFLGLWSVSSVAQTQGYVFDHELNLLSQLENIGQLTDAAACSRVDS